MIMVIDSKYKCQVLYNHVVTITSINNYKNNLDIYQLRKQ